MTANKRKWIEIGAHELSSGSWLLVNDGTAQHACRIDGTVESLLEDYASSYRAGEIGRTVEVTWERHEDGHQEDCGQHSFTAKRA